MSQDAKADARRRLAEALRANLKRRKAAARAAEVRPEGCAQPESRGDGDEKRE